MRPVPDPAPRHAGMVFNCSEGRFRNEFGMKACRAGQPAQIVIRLGCNTLDETSVWTPTTRRQHGPVGLRYGSGLIDAEWMMLQPLLRTRNILCGRPIGFKRLARHWRNPLPNRFASSTRQKPRQPNSKARIHLQRHTTPIRNRFNVIKFIMDLLQKSLLPGGGTA